MKRHLNKGLFSNYYLDELLPREEEFKILSSKLEGVLDEIRKIWDKKHLASLNEPQLRKHFLDKIFEILGWTIDVEPPTPSGEWSKHPDYALFSSKEDLKLAQKGTQEDYFKKSLCIGEAKRWGRPLDRKLREEKDLLEVQNPSLQMSRYLWLTGVKWGILTDGKYWRLYERETSKRLDIFYEIDLESLVENGSVDNFKYFYLFFQKDAFHKFVEKVYKGSIDYAEAVGEELKDNVYQALKFLAQGFLKTPGKNLHETHLKEIHDNSLILLYRLLFILYAEYRGLLPVGENKFYTESYSLDSLKKEIAGKLDRNEPIAATTHGYWSKVKQLFEVINIGNSELQVPQYNGGLFDPDKHEFLERQRVGDFYIARAIDLLSRSGDKAYIDYGSLEIRHLGSIYEGLLEYKLRIAEEDIVPIKEKGKNVFIPLQKAKEESKKIKEEEIVRKGEVYLATDKGERKSTGSYYTPDYIVKYIVSNSLGPLLKDKKKALYERAEFLRERLTDPALGGAQKNAYKEELKNIDSGNGYLEEILKTKLLDPAMGSGHFLVEATDFLAMELLKVLSGEPIEWLPEERRSKTLPEPYVVNKDEEEDIRWARREVVEKCIFGVDLNPLAVELAKLSLWLYTVAKNRPLNFLDHHLRCGNSLIRARIDDLGGLPVLKKKKTDGGPVQLGLFEAVFKEKMNILLGAFAQIEDLPSDTVDQIREKEKLYQDFRKLVSRFQDVADIYTSVYFGNEVDFANYQRLQDKLRSPDEEWLSLSRESWFKNAKGLANEKRFFHWELEFPGVFFEGHRKKENPGFDIVVGNPPYGLVTDPYLKVMLQLSLFSTQYQLDNYVAFMERSYVLTRQQGYQSLIVPATFLAMHYFSEIRRFLLDHCKINALHHFKFPVFEDPTVESALYICQSEPDRDNRERNSVSGIVVESIDDFKARRFDTQSVPQLVFEKIHENDFNISLGPQDANVIEKMRNGVVDLLQQLCDMTVGIKPYQVSKGFPKQTREIVDERVFDANYKKNHTYHQYLMGRDIDRYLINPVAERWISYGEWLAEPRPSAPFFEPERIIVRQTGDSIIAALEDKQRLTLNNIHNLHLKHQPPTYQYLLTILNSRLISFFHQKVVPEADRVFAEVKIVDLERLPIRRITFNNLERERKNLLEKGKMLYERCMKNGNNRPITEFAERNLDAKPERSDVVHDLLASLAEKMIEMNKEKQSEIKGFLEWLENQLKIRPDAKGNTGMDALTGKSRICNYIGDYQKGENHLSFKEFWGILEKNKNRIHANLKSRELYENIQTEYEKSLSKLLPLKEKLRKTDGLIDQIVYRLYGLTEEEIKIVEGNR